MAASPAGVVQFVSVIFRRRLQVVRLVPVFELLVDC